MHDKNIKRLVKKQLKQQFPEWNQLTKREKKELSKQVLEEVVRTYSFDEDIKAPMNELLGTPDIQSADIISLSDMECFIDNHNKRILKLPVLSKGQYIKDPELTAIDKLLEDSIINRLLAPEGYTPCMRVIHPSHMLRAELLKSLKYPEIS